MSITLVVMCRPFSVAVFLKGLLPKLCTSWSFSVMVLWRLWLLAVDTYIDCASLMVLSSITVCGLLLWTVRSVTMDLSWSSVTLLLLLLLYDMDFSCHRPFLPGTSLEPAVIPTAQASSFTLQYFPYYVWCSKYSCLL